MTRAGRILSPIVVEMAAEHLRATPEEITVSHLAGDASTRNYYRAQSAGASVIISLYDEPFDERERAAERLFRFEQANPAARLTFASDPLANIEVTGLLLKAALPVPAIVRVAGAEGAILIEDVGDIKLQDWLEGRSESETFEAYRTAVEFIVKIQAATGVAVESDSICSRLAFDEAKLRWELGFFFAHYFNRYLKVKLDPATSNAVQEDFKSICSELALLPRVLTHRDYHARNLMIGERGMFIIDYQDARLGPESYDLASLIADPYTRLSSQTIDELIEGFIELKANSTLPLSDAAEFRKQLELMTVQRMLKAIGTYSFQAAVKNNSVYVKYIAPALDRALKAIASLGRFERTRALLEDTRCEI